LWVTAFAGQNPPSKSIKIQVSKPADDTTLMQLKIEKGESESIFRITYWDSLSKECDRLIAKHTNEKIKRILTSYKAQSINNIGFINDNEGDTKSAIDYYKKCLEIQKSINDERGEAISLNNLGSSYYSIGENENALDYFIQSLTMQQKNKDKSAMAYTLNNIGGVYDNQGDVSKALEYYLQSLKIDEELKDNQSIVHALNNIGAVYDNQGELTKALEYYTKSLKIREELKDSKGIANSYNNIANILKKQKKYKTALQYYEQASKLQEKISDKNNLALTLKNIGNVYLTIGDPSCEEKEEECKKKGAEKAINYFSRALELAKENESKLGMAYSLNGLADAYFFKNQTQEALQYGLKSFEIAKGLGYPENIKVAANTLKNIYQKLNNHAKAYEMLTLYISMKDSIENDKLRKESKSQEYKYQYEKRESQLKFEQDKRNAIAAESKRKQQITLTAVIFVLIIVVVFSVFMYNRYKLTQQQKLIIEKQKEEVDHQRILAEQRQQLAEHQKEIIEEKNKEITDSITYASRIQRAILTSDEYIKTHLPTDYFIYYLPKDIVSGDYYWATYHKETFYLITADCTGHGVPGAFMSLLNMSFLQEVIVEKSILQPAEILNEQRRRIIKALNPTGTENSKDGMDCVLSAYDLKNKTLQFSAANNPLYLVRNKELIEYKPDKMPVGLSGQEGKSFTNYTIQLEEGDIIYTFTDGYADQFGGERGKKFLYKRFKEMLTENSQLSMEEQKQYIAAVMDDWKKEVEQIDDILVIGIKV